MFFDENCIDEKRIKTLSESEIKAIAKIFSKTTNYCLSCNNPENYGDLLKMRFKTWRGAAREIYRAVRAKMQPVEFCVWEIDNLSGIERIIRRYTFN